MNTRTGITIPSHWKSEVLEEIVENNRLRDDIGVVEVYGALAEGGPVGHGRISKAVVDVSRQDAVKFRAFVKKKNIAFTYLLNAPFSFSSKWIRCETDRYLEWIFSELQPDAVTIASLELMERVREINLNIEIHISTIAGVKTATDLEKYLRVGPSRVVPHHDCGKDWRNLREVAEFGRANGIGVELLSTESCLLRCSMRDAHYAHIARKDDRPFHMCCNSRKLTHPEELLLASATIRPEDMRLFEEMGVSYFKISGRSKSAEWLPEVARAYQCRSFDGNLVRLLGIDPQLRAEEWIYLDNKSLEGFMEGFPQSATPVEEVRYAQKWIVKLFREGKFRILDGSEYAVDNGQLVLQSAGECAAPIIARESKK